MKKLCHALAIQKQIKTTADTQLTAIYHAVKKDTLLNGISRTYKPRDEDGERFPDEKQEVQLRIPHVLDEIASAASPLLDSVATIDAANCNAKADVIVDGEIVMKNVAVTTLLYIEKQLVHINTVFNSLPELPQTETWTYDPNTDSQKTEPAETSKSKKIAKPFVKYAATDKHPAQVDVVTEDVLVGYWSTTKFSGALPRERKRQLVDRVNKLLMAVKTARETANQQEAPPISVAKEVFGFLMAS